MNAPRRNAWRVNRRALALLLLFACLATPGAWTAVAEATVYVRDSDDAQRLWRALQAETDADRASRLAERLLRDFPDRLVAPDDEAAAREPRLYLGVAEAVRQEAMRRPTLRRAIEARRGPEARRRLREADRSLDPAAIYRDVADRFPLTGAGFDAALELARRHMLAGRIAAATGLLERCGEVAAFGEADPRAVAWWELHGLAAAWRGEAEDARRSIEMLAALGAGEAGERVAAAIERSKRPGARSVLTMRSPAWTDGFRGSLELPLWRVDWSPRDRAGADRGGLPDANVPEVLIVDDTVLVGADGVVASVALRGPRLRWSWRSGGAEPADAEDKGGPGPAAGAAAGLGVGDDIVAAVLDESDRGPGVWGRVERRSSVAALDLKTGRLRWRIQPEAVNAALAGARFQGRPLCVDDTVYVAMHDERATGLAGWYLAALDARTGAPRWVHQVVSVAITRGAASAPPATLGYDAGRVFVQAPGRALACFDARSGETRWVRTTPRDAGGLLRRASRPSPPLITPMGLAVLVDDGLLIADPATGQTLRHLVAPLSPPDPAELRLLGEDLLVIGRAVQRIDGRTLERQWSTPLVNFGWGGGQPPVIAGEQLYLFDGRGGITRIDLATGRKTSRVSAPVSAGYQATALRFDRQWLVADAHGLAVYQDAATAAGALRTRLEQDPGDGEAALDWVAMATERGDGASVRDAIEAALDALSLMRSRRPFDAEGVDRLFDELLSWRPGESGTRWMKSPPTRRWLLDRLEQAPLRPVQRIAVELAAAEHDATAGDATSAAVRYHRVLSSPHAGHRELVIDGAAMSARRAAMLQLDRLLRRAGREAYRPIEADAVRALRALRVETAGRPTPEALRTIAAQYPFAIASAEALLTAASLHRRAGELDAAQEATLEVLRWRHDDAIRAAAVGEMLELYLESGAAATAERWLDQLAVLAPDLQPVDRHGRARSLAWWAARVATDAEDEKVPWLRAFEHVHVRPGRSMVASGEGVMTRRVDDRLTRASLGVSGVSRWAWWTGPSGPTWEASLPAQRLELVDVSPTQVLVRGDPGAELWALSRSSGRVQWGPMSANWALGGAGEREQGWTAAAATDDVVVLIASDQRAAGVDRYTGRVLWRRPLPAMSLRRIAMTRRALGIGLGSPDGRGSLLVIDPLTGETKTGPVALPRAPSALSISDDGGSLLCGLLTSTVCIDGATGRIRWEVPRVTSPLLAIGHGRAVLRDRSTGELTFRDLASGEVQRVVSLDPLVDEDRVVIRPEADGWLLATPQQITWLEPDGSVRFRDGLATSRRAIRSVARVGSRLAVLIARPDELRPEAADGARLPRPIPPLVHDGPSTPRLVVVDLASGRLIADRLLPPLSLPAALHHVDGRLFISTRDAVWWLGDEADRRAAARR